MGIKETSPRLPAAALLFAVVAVIGTWPLITDIAGHTLIRPYDSDPLFNLYVIHWGAHALVTDPLGLHHTNMFHPETYTFAYSDIELSTSILMLPVILTTGDPFLVYSLFILAAIVIGCLGFYLLALDLTGSRAAAIIGALIYAFNPTHFGRYVQIQLFADLWLPWFAWALLRWFRLGRWPWAAAAALLFCANALSGSHVAAFGMLLGAVLTTYYLIGNGLWRKKWFWSGIALMGGISIAILMPVFYPYLIVEGELSRDRLPGDLDLALASSRPRELLSAGSVFYRWLDNSSGWPSKFFPDRAASYLFPGVIAVLLALLGFFPKLGPMGSGKNRSAGNEPAIRHWAAWVLDAVALFCMALTLAEAFGVRLLPAPTVWTFPLVLAVTLGVRLAVFRRTDSIVTALPAFIFREAGIGFDQAAWVLFFAVAFLTGLGPFFGFYKIISTLPAIKLIRVPSRFMLPAAFALAVLAAYGAAALAARFRGLPKRVAALGLVVLLFAVEAAYVPLPLYRYSPNPPEVYRWLGEQEGDFAVVEFPMGLAEEGVTESAFFYGRSARQVFCSIYHWKKLLIGYSGYRSQENKARMLRLDAGFPGSDCLDELRSLGVRYVLVHEAEPAAGKKAGGGLKHVRSFGGVNVYELIPAPAE